MLSYDREYWYESYQSYRGSTGFAFEFHAEGFQCCVNHLMLGSDVRNGRTVLHYAVRCGDARSVELLLSKGASVNARDKV